jgi:hypothetical protein
MMFRRTLLVIALFCIGILIIRCSKKESCDNTICTQEYRTLNVRIQDSNGAPAVFDKIDIMANSTVVKSVTSPQISGSDNFTIADDSYMVVIGKNQTITANALIYKNSLVVKNLIYTVQTDCCHVTKLIGDSLVIIN